MKTRKVLRGLSVMAVFAALSFGVSSAKVVEKIAGEEVTTTSLSLVNSASATCSGSGGIGKGKCTFAGRCGAVYPGETSDCDTDDVSGHEIQ